MKPKLKKVVSSFLVAMLLIPVGWVAPVMANTTNTVYHETFENTSSVPKRSGEPTFTRVNDKVFEGNEEGGAVHLTDRKNTWDGIDFDFADIGIQNGIKYNITVKGYVDSDVTVPEGSLASLQPINASTNEYSAPWIASSALVAGKSFTITGAYTADTNTHATLRIGSSENGKTVPFYIGDVLITTDSSAVVPEPSDEFQAIEIANYNFDAGTTQGWGNRGEGKAAATTEAFQSGTHSLKVTDREDTWHGTEISMTNLLMKDAEYEIKGYAKLVEGQSPSNIKFTMIVTDADGDTYTEVTPLTEVTDEKWVELSSELNFKAEDFTSLTLYAESDNENVQFYLDDITITMVAPPVHLLHDFEDGELGDWVRRNGDGDIAITTEDNNTPDGQYSLKTTVSEQYDGALLDVAGKMEKGHQYRLTARVKMAEGQSPTTFRISVQYGSSSFANVSEDITVNDENWATLTGLYTQSTAPGSVLNAYVEIANSYGEPRTFLMDDFQLTYVKPVAGPNPDYTLPSLHEVYEDYFPIGNIMNPGDFTDEERLNFLKKHSVLLSAENGMKPEYAYDNTGKFDFKNMDELVDNALENEFQVHGHVLVWHAQSPAWLHTGDNGEPLPREEALENLRTHIKTVVEKYGEKVISWDVVNEAVEDSKLDNPTDWESTLRESGWFKAIGPDFIYEAFKAAREVIDENDWDIELYYNDYNDDNQRKATAIATMVKELNEKYAEENPGKKLIDGIGMQAHYNLNTSADNVRASIERIIDIGVKVGVTELDVMAGSDGVQTEEEAKAQAYLYAQLFQIYKEYADHITRVTFWGMNDGSSWRSENSPLIFDSRYQAKPAYYAVIDPDKYIEENPPVEKEYLQSTAAYGTPVIDGSEDTVWSKAPELPLNRYQTAHNGATGVAKVLWDDKNLYVLIETNDTNLDDTSTEAHQQDSVEVFLDENNAKSTAYQEDDAQYRVNFKNIATFNPQSAEEGFESKTVVGDTYYKVEMKIPFKTIKPSNNKKIGFDAQINDASDGARQSVAIWNDMSGAGWQNPSVFGVLTLKGKPGSETPSQPGTGSGGNDIAEPVVTVRDGQAIVTVTDDYLRQALGRATTPSNGKKQVVIEIKAQEGINSSAIELPTSSLNSKDEFVLIFKTPQGTIEIPSNMLSNFAGVDAEHVTIVISSANADELDDAVRESIGNRPVIQLHVLANGKVLEWNNPNAPVTVAIPYTPTAAELQNPDHILIWYIDEDGNAIAVPNSRYDAANGVVNFKTTHFSTYAVTYMMKSFDDLAKVPWAKKAIEVMASRDVIKGVSANLYNPSDSIKRADFIALLVRALELQSDKGAGAMFSDVKATDYFYNEVRIAKELGIANGTGDNLFNPHESISRQDMMVLAARAMKVAGIELNEGSLDAYSDANQVSSYAKESVAALVEAGIVNGMNGMLVPKEPLTRAQAAVILYGIWSVME